MTQPSNGKSTPQANGVMYTPNPDFCGTDSFTYTVADPYGTEGSDTATVLINVLCEETTDPDTPTADVVVLNDDEAETMANSPISIAVLENDVVPSGEFLYNINILIAVSEMVNISLLCCIPCLNFSRCHGNHRPTLEWKL